MPFPQKLKSSHNLEVKISTAAMFLQDYQEKNEKKNMSALKTVQN